MSHVPGYSSILKSNVFNFILGEELELHVPVRQPANDGVETLLDKSPTAHKESSEIKKVDFVKLNDGNLLDERDIEVRY